MKRVAIFLAFAVLYSVPAAIAEEHETHGSMIAASPQWEQVKSLVGEWDGYALHGEQKIPTHISVRLTGDGSAVMHWIDAGTAHEMVTMFHMDKDQLLATHYCSAHNQPRFRALPSAQANQIAFDDYLVKPITSDNVQHVINKYCSLS